MRNLVFGCLVLTACLKKFEPTEVEPPTSPPATEIVPETQVDTFTAAPAAEVDILFVVDNSSSMGDEQLSLSTQFPLFLEDFIETGSDFHIGVVATDMDDPEFQGTLRTWEGHRFVEATTPDPVGVFEGMISTLGVIVGSNEAGRAAAYTALEVLADEPSNEGFLRDEASLQIIFVTDADDYSGNAPISKSDFFSWAAELKPVASMVQMHAIVGLQADPDCPTIRPGFDYLEYAAASNGDAFSICLPDWEAPLAALNEQIASVPPEFFLTRVPVTEPEVLIEVVVRTPISQEAKQVCLEDDDDPTCAVFYRPQRNSIQFPEEEAPQTGEVEITYDVLEDGSP